MTISETITIVDDVIRVVSVGLQGPPGPTGAAGANSTPGGADTNIQYNSGGTTFGGSALLTYASAQGRLTVKQKSGSLANVTEWKDSGNNVVASMSGSGDLTSTGTLSGNFVSSPVGSFGSVSAQTATLTAGGPSEVPLTLVPAPSALGPAIQLIDAGLNTPFTVDKDGNVTAPTFFGDVNGTTIAASTLTTTGGADVGGALTCGDLTAGSVSTGHCTLTTGDDYTVLRVIGADGQTANLTEWQDNSNTVMASVGPNGAGLFAGLETNLASTFHADLAVEGAVSGVTLNITGDAFLGTAGLPEQGSTPAAQPGTAILYAIDNGSGKTKLMVRFPTGSPIQLAIEP